MDKLNEQDAAISSTVLEILVMSTLYSCDASSYDPMLLDLVIKNGYVKIVKDTRKQEGYLRPTEKGRLLYEKLQHTVVDGLSFRPK